MEIHWLAVINSFVLVVLLTSFLAIILVRILKNDFSRYMRIEQDEEAADEDSGWKLLHGDVFRFPSNPMLFSAFIGTGCQFFCLVTSIILLALMGTFYPMNRGSLYVTAIVLYSLTSGFGGYYSARFYKQIGGTNWVWNIILTAVLFPAPLFFVFSFVNTVAISYDSSAALPFTTILIILCLFLFVCFPLTVLGGIAGKNSNSEFDAPCRTTKVEREIPEIPWYRQSVSQIFIAGFLPFSAIYIELHYIFVSVWGHRIYTLFGILLIAYIMLLIVTSFVTIALTYFQLAVEDHKWWWRSFFSGGATGIFIYVYCFYFFFQRSEMYGMLQGSFFFGYMAIVSYGFFIMLGTIGFLSSLKFVKHIYKAIKADLCSTSIITITSITY